MIVWVYPQRDERAWFAVFEGPDCADQTLERLLLRHDYARGWPTCECGHPCPDGEGDEHNRHVAALHASAIGLN